MPSCGVCLSVRLSVTFMFSVEMTKHILEFFHWVARPFWLFNTKRYGNIPAGSPPLTNAGGVNREPPSNECRWGRQKCDSRVDLSPKVKAKVTCCLCCDHVNVIYVCHGPWNVLYVVYRSSSSRRWNTSAPSS